MKPGFLESPSVIEWLRGKEPAWTLLTFESWCALHRKPGETGCAFSLSGETSSTLASNALTFLSRIGQGTKLTTTGNLTRAFVAEMVAAFVWPDSDPGKAFVRRNVANEPDFTPLHAVRIFCDRAKLVRVEGRQLRLTKKAQTLVAKGNVGSLNRFLFEAAFWNTNLAYFDGFRLAPWPQGEIGTILWCLSVAANDWQKPDDLVRLCATPVIGVLEAERDESGAIFEARILRVLAWFDLLEVESTPDENWSYLERRRYRKSKTFDAFFHFAVTLEPSDMPIQ
jgi:hypothetical protein